MKNKASPRFKGVNLGGWLNMEGYLLQGRNIAESEFKERFAERHGEAERDKFERIYRGSFITGEDFKNIAALGANTVRLPFNCRLIETAPYHYSDHGLAYLTQALDWAHQKHLGIILDLHAAPGSQNHDWHSDSRGEALLWDDQKMRDRALALWEFVAGHVKDHPGLAGYDVLNEPVVGDDRLPLLKEFYRSAVRRLRSIDPERPIFLEGNIWAQNIDFLADLLDDNVHVSIHTYAPIEFTFNLVRGLRYPGTIAAERYDTKKINKYLEMYAKFAITHNVRVLVGEFGVNWRGGHSGEIAWLSSMLSSFDAFGFDYTYWTYKSFANAVFPDGLYQYLANPAFVRREGPVYGWENYLDSWKNDTISITESWKTENFTPNRAIIAALKKHFNRKIY